ncbi:insulinase family protein [uncultured Acetobacteroides sp.]|uniref:M16 family metallopeptidase n=1 Tax=uncultured Acetobacteroides sp. TaxID=1760811 RepID=UPI0029F59DF3|nr:insulinase family protein [uncultured Acetobacteroides sp.]
MRKTSLVLLMVALLCLPALAQQMPTLPTDPKVRVGKLDNGLTYYIRHNAEPKGQADFYIAQKVGSILEEESQRGLAHFLEHMAFNGTKNFPGKKMPNYLETIGVKFGANLNAATGWDQTIYNINNAPVTREGSLDSCLLILHDWSSFISLEDKEIDAERGVIHEEWRTRNNAQSRMSEKMFADVYGDGQYAKRSPIGLMSVIDNFKYQEIKDYYHKWYRPDLQGLVIVGDIDVDKVEAKLKSMFADIAKPVNPAERTEFEVKDNDAPIVSIATDPEAPQEIIRVMYKRDLMPKELRPTVAGLMNYYLSELTQNMLNSRLEELGQKADAPFAYAGCNDGKFMISNTKDAFSTVALAKTGKTAAALATLANEAERVRKFGFTAGEYERAKSNFLRKVENEFKDREKQKNRYYVNQYLENFISDSPIPGIETEYTIFQQVSKMLPLEQVNKYAAEIIGEKNVVIAINGPQKDGITYPTKEEAVAIFNKARTENVTAYVDKVSNEPLIKVLPKAGKVVKEEKGAKFGETIWTLSNGAKVLVKKTDFKEDEIMFTATSMGGNSLVDDKEATNLKALNDVIALGGIGSFSAIDLPKMLAGKKAEVSASVGTEMEGLNGSCSPKDLETMMQLTYLTVTAPRTDNEAFQSFVSRTKAMLANMEAQPMVAFSDSVTAALYGKHPRAQRMTAAMMDKIDYARCLEIYKQRFANIGDFTFTFVGNIDEKTLKPMVEQYIASLPGNGKKETFRDVKMYPRKGEYKNIFEKEMKTPKATVSATYTGKVDYSVDNRIKMSILSQIMNIVYTKTIREDEGGTYGVQVGGNVSRYPYGSYTFRIRFDTDPKQVDRLSAKAKAGLDELIKDGPSAENLNKVKEYMLKNYTEAQRDNGHWLDAIDTYYTLGIDNQNGYDAKIKAITTNDIKEFAAKLFAQKNEVDVIMKGVEKK